MRLPRLLGYLMHFAPLRAVVVIMVSSFWQQAPASGVVPD